MIGFLPDLVYFNQQIKTAFMDYGLYEYRRGSKNERGK